MSSPTSQVSGLVSGMDWETTIKQLMAIEQRKPAMLETQKQDNETKLNLWAQIQSKVALLQGAAQGIDTRSEFAVKSASSSDTTIVAVSADASAATGSHSIDVLQLAKAHRIAGQGWADKNSTGVGDSGGDLVISINGKTITVTDADLSSSTTLEQLRNLINSDSENDNLVTASIIDDGSKTNKYRLVLSANDTGSVNAISVTSNPTDLNFSTGSIDAAETGTGWSGTSAITTGGTYTGNVNKTFTFTINGSGSQTIGSSPIDVGWEDSVGNTGTVSLPAGYAGGSVTVANGVQVSFGAGDLKAGDTFKVDTFTPQLTAAQDAQIKFDGIYMSKASNSITDILEGVTLDLVSTDATKTVEVSVQNDKDAVKQKIQGFVDSYNSLMNDVATYSSYDDKNKTAAPLLGDAFLTGIKGSLSSVCSQQVTNLPNGSLYDSLAVVGIKGTTNALLSIDSTALDNALDNHFDDVVNMFTQTFSTEDSKINYVSATTTTKAGDYALDVNYDAAGQITSAKINGKAAIVDGNLIRGAEKSDAEGLVLTFTSPGNGAGSLSTTFKYGKGAAASIASEAVAINDETTGQVHYATDALTTSNDSIDRQLATWTTRLSETESQLRHQFTMLETALSQMKNQSSYLSGVLG